MEVVTIGHNKTKFELEKIDTCKKNCRLETSLLKQPIRKLYNYQLGDILLKFESHCYKWIRTSDNVEIGWFFLLTNISGKR